MCYFLLQRFNRPVEAGLKTFFRTISEGPEKYLIMLRFKGVSRKLDKLKGEGVVPGGGRICFESFESARSSKMAFLESSLSLSLGPFINYFIIICVDTIRESGWIITTNWPISTIHLGLFG